MTVGQKFVFWALAFLAPLGLLSGVTVSTIVSQGRAMQAATDEYRMADRAAATAVQVGWLRDSLRGADGPSYHDLRYFAPITAELREVVRDIQEAARTDDGDAAAETQLARELPATLEEAMKQVADNGASVPAAEETARRLERVHAALLAAERLGPDAARRHIAATSANVSARLLWTLFWLGVALLLSAAIHYKQYRLLVRPLVKLRDDMRKAAALQFQQEIQATGDAEFREMALYFNGLARELMELYRNLEAKVVARSRELVRSERLASVGFLAAGVAHEINNPLGIISGYAELSGKGVRELLNADVPASPEAHAEAEAAALAAVLEAQTIIREEAFRCKEITGRLLSLARGGSDGREPLCLCQVARQVTVLVKGLRNYRERRIELEFADGEPLRVMANPTEMKQVLLNLAINALEAASGHNGEVRIGGRMAGDRVEVFVHDNGRGMSPVVLEQIFEPFFTARRGTAEPGTGLGLSITHAIVENHGGTIRAESAGAGRGSRFTVTLPALVSSPVRRGEALAGR
jgi:signal transduction histidine kinase